jgi:sugar phosphate isomerase/epimerase
METHTRRHFLENSLHAGATLAAVGLLGRYSAAAVEPIKRSGAPSLRLSLAAYSLRDYFNNADASRRISLFDFIDFCAKHGCQGTELTSYYFPKDLTTDFLIQVKRHAFLRGLDITGSAVGNNFVRRPGPDRDRQIASVKKWIDHAAVLGAPHIRVFAGDAKDIELAEGKKLCVSALEECAEYAGTRGVFLGLENHGGIVSDVKNLLDIVQAVKSPWLAVNLDTGNFYSDADPYLEMARLAPYAVNVQLKVEVNRRGKGKELVDLPRVVKLLRDANYQGYVALEYEAAADPWKEVPVWLGRMREAFAG